MIKTAKIWGELVPCTEFIGAEGISEEKKKEMWVKVCSNSKSLTKYINKHIWFRGTKINNVYEYLRENPTSILDVQWDNAKQHVYITGIDKKYGGRFYFEGKDYGDEFFKGPF